MQTLGLGLGLGGSSSGAGAIILTAVAITSSNSPYTAVSTDDLLLFKEDATSDPTNVSLAAVFYATPITGQKITAVWWTTQTGAPPPTVTGGGSKSVESIATPGTLIAAGTTIALPNPFSRATWEYDGTEWVLLPGS